MVAADLRPRPQCGVDGLGKLSDAGGYVCGGWQMARAGRAAQAKLATGEDPVFYGAKLATARFYMDQILPKADALLRAVKSGASTALTLTEEQF